MLAPARKGSDTDETAFVDTGAADGGEGGVAGPGDASLRTRAVLQHLLVRASAGASHQAGRPGGHQDRRRRRHGLERQERGVRAQPADRARSTSKAPSPATCWSCRSRRSSSIAPTPMPSSLLAPYAVDPAAIAARVDREARRVTWKLDKARGVATLTEPDITPALELPLRPMLGCVGVAPARKEAIATSTPGPVRRQHGLRRPGRRREGDAAGQRAGRAAVPRRRPCPSGRGRGRRAPGSRRRWTWSSRSNS